MIFLKFQPYCNLQRKLKLTTTYLGPCCRRFISRKNRFFRLYTHNTTEQGHFIIINSKNVSSLVSGSVEAGRAVRTTMSTYSTPFLVLNLGSEMIFVIAQRLQAQNIAEERAILGDIFKLVSTFSVSFFLLN